ncbi:CBS domain-containing protein [Candidatus Woesearchaeota archaeon]|nr:CBS domain-containing protein [Candidatus Woesearchaeota archaeon]
MTTDVATVDIGATIFDADQIMAQKHISCVIITESKEPLGIITERDMIRVMLTREDPATINVTDYMSTPLLSIRSEDDLFHAVNLMKDKNLRRFPVIDNGILVGLVTQSDLLKGLIKLIKHLNHQLVKGEINLKTYEQQISNMKHLSIPKNPPAE